MARSEYNGQNLFDREATARYAKTSKKPIGRFLDLEPIPRSWELEAVFVETRRSLFGSNQMHVTVDGDALKLVRRSLSIGPWLVVFAVLVAYTKMMLGRIGETGEWLVLPGLGGILIFCYVLVAYHPFNDVKFHIDERQVTMRKRRGSELRRPSAQIQRCEYSWTHHPGFEGGPTQFLVVVFEGGERFEAASNTEVLNAVRWFCPDVPLLEVPPVVQKVSKRPLRSPVESAERLWRRYEASLESDVSSST